MNENVTETETCLNNSINKSANGSMSGPAARRNRQSGVTRLFAALLLANLATVNFCKAEESQYVTPNILTVANGGFNNADDAVSPDLEIGFTFTYGGVSYTRVRMSSNGILFFSGADPFFSNFDLSAVPGNIGVYALWDDLYVGTGGNESLSRALYYTAGTPGNRVFIMQWGNWYSFAETYEVGTFNVVLYEGSNKIDIYYRNMLGASEQRGYGASATIGIVAPGDYYNQYSMNSPVATEGKLLTYTPAAGGNSPYTLSEQMVTAATTAAIQTYYLTYTSSPQIAVNLSASPNPASSSATLSWDLSSLGEAPTGYKIRYATNAQMSGLMQTDPFSSSGQNYVLNGLTPGTTYYWQVVSTIGSLSSISTISSFALVPNTAPVADNASFSTEMNAAYNGTLSATDADNTPNTSGLIYSIVTRPASGNVVLNDSSAGTFTYTPNADFSGGDSFTFKAFDGTAYSAEATISVTVGSSGASGIYGSPFSYTISGGGSPIGYGASGLPRGLTIDGSTGLINGTPTESGTFSVTLFVTNTGDTASSPLNLTISNATLTVAGILAEDRIYDGGTNAVLNTSGATMNGVVSGDDVSLDTTVASGTFANKSAGVAKVVTVSGLTLVGTTAGYYTLVPPSTTASISAKGLTVTGLTALNKPYDGNASATLNSSEASLDGVVSGDNVTIDASVATGTFADQNVGQAILVTISGVALGGNDAGNYSLTQPTAAADITEAVGTVILGNLTQIYDGNAKSVTANTIPGGLSVSLTYNGQVSPPTNAGIYTVVGTISDGNYAGSATNQLRIAMAGPAVAWGKGTAGQLGNGFSTNSKVPVAIVSSGALAGKTIVSVAGGNNHSYALTSDGLVYSWGANTYGQLGNNGSSSSLVPVLVYTNGVLSGKRVVAIVSGENHALALSADNKLFTWGWNWNKQLGNGSSVQFTNVPVEVDMTGVLAGKTVVALGSGNMHNLVVTADGQLFTWGYGANGQLGNGTTGNSSVPVAVNMNGVLLGKRVIAASGGWEHSVALTADGLVFCWGAGGNAQLGDGQSSDSSVPVAVSTSGVLSGKTIEAIGAGEFHCLAVSSEGQVYAWGPNSYGELGDGTDLSSDLPVAVSTSGVLAGKKVVAVCGTYDSSTALTDDGQVFSWGLNMSGELGTPDYPFNSLVPVPVFGAGVLAGQTVVAISSSSQASHNIVLTVGLSAPIITSATNAAGTYGQTLTFTATGKNVEGFGASDLPGWLTLDPLTGILSGTPNDVGVFNITLQATNAFGSTSTNLTLTIDKANLTILGAAAASKIYDGAPTATIEGTPVLVGVHGSDDVSLSGSPIGSFENQDVGVGKQVTISGYTLSGLDAGKYNLTQPTASADITAKALTVNGLTANGKTYDGEIAASLNVNGAELSGVVSGDTVNLNSTGASGTFADKTAGPAKTVLISGLTISGGSSVNYTLIQPTATADITAKNLTMHGVTASDKSYDGTTVAALNFSGAALSGVVAPDNVTFNAAIAVGAFADKNVGNDILVTVTGVELSGTDAGNYTLTQPSTAGNITKAAATVTLSGLTQTYDGTAKSATIATTPSALGVSLTYEGAAAAPTNAGSYTVVATINDSTYQGSATGNLQIAKAPLTVKADDKTWPYGYANPTFTVTYVGFVIGDNEGNGISSAPIASISATQPGGILTNKFGSYPISVSGGSAQNYTFSYVSGTLTVLKAPLTITVAATNRPYGQPNPQLNSTITGVVGTDNLTVNPAANATQSSPPGTYTINTPVNDPKGRLGWYSITWQVGTFTVNPAPLVGVVQDQTRAYGQTNAPFAINYTGWVLGQDSSLLSGNLVYTCVDTNGVAVGAATAVGAYPIHAAGQSAANYSVSYQDGTLTVTQAVLNVVAQNAQRLYGDVNPAFSANITGFENGDTTNNLSGTLNLTTEANASSPVGQYDIAASGYSSANYQIVFTGGMLTVDPAHLTVSGREVAKVYGSPLPELSGSISGIVNNERISATFHTDATASSPVANYSIYPAFEDLDHTLSNYQITTNLGTLAITPAQLTVTADAQARAYGETNPVLTATISGFVNEDSSSVVSGTPTLTTTAETNSSVGPYEITVDATPLSAANYTFTPANGTLTVTQAVLLVKADDQGRLYGATNPVLTATISGFVNDDGTNVVSGNPLLETLAETNSPVGPYPITVDVTGLSAQNYSFAGSNGTLTIGQATLLVSANPQERAYGASNPELTWSYSGFLPGDDASVLNGGPVLSTTADSSSAVGSYDITIATGTLQATNYVLTLSNSTLTVTRAQLVVKADDKSRTYGAANPELTLSYIGFANDESETVLESQPTASTLADAASSVNDYEITVTGGSAGNYELVRTSGTLSVTPASLTIQAQDLARAYGAANPEPVLSYSGFVNDENNSVLREQPTVTIGADALSSANASYPIHLSGGLAGNYSISLVDGSLSVTQALITATADPKQRTYGAANPEFTITYAGFVNDENQSVLTAPAIASTTADATSPANQTYAITVSGGTALNYQVIPVNGTLTVNPAMLTVKADDLNRAYGATNPVLTATITGLLNHEQATEVVTGSAALETAADATSPVGSYPITTVAGTLAAQNYTFQFVNGTLTVDKAPLLVQADPKSRLYGETNPVFTATISGFVNGDATTVVSGNPVLDTAATPASPVGQYDITVTQGDLSATNYNFVTTNGVLTIARAMLTIVADDQQRMYGQSNPSLTFHFEPSLSDSNLLTGEPALSTEANAGSSVASYPITIDQGTLASTEYAFTFQNGSLTVTQAVLTVTANNASRIYGAANPTFRGSYTGRAEFDEIWIQCDSAATETDSVGSYDIVPGIVDPMNRLANYVVITNLGTLTVTPASLEVWANDQSKVYGDANPALTGTNSALVAGDEIAIAYETEATDHTSVGNYSIVPSFTDSASRLGNYTVTAHNGNLQITPRALLVTANDATRPYGQPNPVFGMTYNGFATGDDATSLETAPTATSYANSAFWVGTYPIVAAGGVSANYTFTYVDGSLTIGKAPLTISGPSVSRAYGTTNPVFVATIAGLMNDDFITASYTSTATPTDPPGIYGILLEDVQDDLGILGAYDVTLLGGTLTITNAALIGHVHDASKVYGSANPEFSVSYTGFANGDNATLLTGSVEFSCVDTNRSSAVDTNTSVGAYPIHVTSGQNARYYGVTYLDGTLSVTPATLTVAGDPKSRLYGSTNPVLTATINGFLNDDTTNVVTGAPELSTTAAVDSPIGQYPITVLAGDLSATNYTFVTTNSTLSITPNLLSVIADDQSRSYGATNPVLAFHFSGLLAGDTAESISGSPAISTAADTNSPVTNYVISIDVGTLASTNYAFAFTNGTLSVTQAELIATADNQSRPYGSENPELTIAYSGFVNGQTQSDLESQPTASTPADSSSPVIDGGYPISLSGGSDRNYNIRLVDGTLTVTKVTLVASATHQTRYYGDSNPPLGVRFTGFVNNDNEAVLDTLPLATTSATEATGAGTYTILLSGGSDNNYDITTENGSLTIRPAPLTLSAPTLTRVYGSENPELTIGYDGFRNGDTADVFESQPTISTPATVTSSVGDYPITIEGASAVNYEITMIEGSLTITAAPLSVTAADASRAFGVENPEFTGTMTGVKNSDPITVSYECSATVESPAGTYPIVPSLLASSEVLANYSIASANGTLTVIGGLTLSTNAGFYTVGDPAVLIDTNASFADGGGINFSNASLTVAIVSNIVSDDVLSFVSGTNAQQASVIGSTLFYNSSPIGTWSGGSGGQPLAFALNGNANSTAITALMRQLTFATPNTNSASREFQFTVTYGSTAVAATRAFVLNRAPVAGDIQITAAEGLTIEIPVSELLAHASDVDQDTVTLTGVSWVSAYGGLINTSSETVTYHPPVGGLTGEDVFAYLVEDGRGGQDVGLITLKFVAVNKLQLDMSDVAASGAKLTMGGTPGRSYIIQASSDLATWNAITTVTADQNGIIQVLDAQAQNYPSRFYRAIAQ